MSSPIVAQENGLGPSAYSQVAAVCSMPGANQAGSIIWVCSTRKVTKPLTRPAKVRSRHAGRDPASRGRGGWEPGFLLAPE